MSDLPDDIREAKLRDWYSTIRRDPPDHAAFQIPFLLRLLDEARGTVPGDPPRDPVIEAVRVDLLRRQQLGYVKYGGTLATNPAGLRGALQHAYEEALDLCNYLKWSMMQLDGAPELKPDPAHSTGLREK